MKYPLTLTFKILAIAPQISVKDAAGNEICYVRQKLFKLKEKISVFTDSTKESLLCEIHADRILDFSAAYEFRENGTPFGSVKRRGMRSFWKAHYEISDSSSLQYTVTEGNPWIKILDSMCEGIPILGSFSGYLFHPYYEVKNQAGETCYILRKQSAFLEGKFAIEELKKCDDDILVWMSLMMLTLLEKKRG